MRSWTRATAVVGACLGLAACGGDDDDSADTGAATRPEASAAAETAQKKNRGPRDAPNKKPPGTTITTVDSQFGEILFDGDERAIYLFDKETSSRSECYGECAEAWPPVLTKGEPRAAGRAQGKLLDTTRREDGKTQVTYDGQPLYYYVDDPRGEVLCHNVEEFGGLWLVLEPSGAAVQ